MPKYKVTIKATNENYTIYNKTGVCDFLLSLDKTEVDAHNVLCQGKIDKYLYPNGCLIPVFKERKGYLFNTNIVNWRTSIILASYISYEMNAACARDHAKNKYFDEFLIKDDRYIIEEV